MSIYRMYVAQCLWDLDTGMRKRLGVENDMPQYVDLIHPESKKKQPTAEEIKQHLLERLR